MLIWQEEGLWAEIVSFGSFGISAEMKFFEMGFSAFGRRTKIHVRSTTNYINLVFNIDLSIKDV